LYTLACAAALMVLVALWLLEYIESAVPRRRFRTLVVRCAWYDQCIEDLVQRLESSGVSVEDRSFQRQDDMAHVDIELSVSFTNYERYLVVERALQEDSRCRLMRSSQA
jgi:uncharacterized membrane protein YhiD involved in acid resistance